MSRTKPNLITTFAQYVKRHCPRTYENLPASLKDEFNSYIFSRSDIELSFELNAISKSKLNQLAADFFAAKGAEIIHQIIKNPEQKIPGSVADHAAYLQWFLIKHSYIKNKSFSEGMFNLKLGDKSEATFRLYNHLRDNTTELSSSKIISLFKLVGYVFLGAINTLTFGYVFKSNKYTYPRMSSHYRNKLVRSKNVPGSHGHYGIDVKKSGVPLPANFRNCVFAICNDGTLYFKPETSSSDISGRFVEAVFIHLLDLVKYLILKSAGKKKAVLPGTDQEMYDENFLRSEVATVCDELTKPYGKKINWTRLKNLTEVRAKLLTVLSNPHILDGAERLAKYDDYIKNNFHEGQVCSELRYHFDARGTDELVVKSSPIEETVVNIIAPIYHAGSNSLSAPQVQVVNCKITPAHR